MVQIEHILMNNCRLCHNKPGQYDINSDKKLVKEIYDCVKIKVIDKTRELLPHSVCEECRKIIKDFFQYKQHIQKVDRSLRKILNCKSKDAILNKFKCPECPAEFNVEELFKSHRESHSCNNKYLIKREDFYAPFCEDDLSFSKENLEKRDVYQEDNNLNSFHEVILPAVKREESKSGKLIVTDEKIKTGNEKNVICTECDQNFNNAQELKLHKKSHRYICPWKSCKKILNSAYTLKTHELKHAGKRSFLCVTCGKGFITKNSLTCHEKIHLDIKGYTCKLCNIGFSVRSNLRAHEKKHHEGVRFYCSQCTKAFISKSSLERHERTHTGIKEFQCESCPSAFYTNKELMKHQRYHQGLRLHKCNECFKTFFERHHLIIHLRIHTGERPYVCKVPNCGKSFMESQKLKRHHKAKHAQT